MFKHNYFHDTMKKYVAYFGTLFNDIRIDRVDDTGAVVQTIRVPLQYGPRNKLAARLAENEALDKPVATTFPRMTFEMGTFGYDASRKLPRTGKNFYADTTNGKAVLTQYKPTPWNISWTLSIFSRNTEDGSRVVEQILPYFTPDWTSTLNLVPSMGIKVDVPITLDSVQLDTTGDGPIASRKYVIWTLNFTMKATFFGAIERSGIIKKAIASIFTNTSIRSTASIDMLSAAKFSTDDVVYQGNSTVNTAIGIVHQANSSILKIDVSSGHFVGNLQIRSESSNAYANVTGITSSGSPLEVIQVTPGLTSNGTPTSNSQLAINYLSVVDTDNYGFLIQYAEEEADLI